MAAGWLMNSWRHGATLGAFLPTSLLYLKLPRAWGDVYSFASTLSLFNSTTVLSISFWEVMSFAENCLRASVFK